MHLSLLFNINLTGYIQSKCLEIYINKPGKNTSKIVGRQIYASNLLKFGPTISLMSNRVALKSVHRYLGDMVTQTHTDRQREIQCHGCTYCKQEEFVLLTQLSDSSFQRAIWTSANVHFVYILYLARVLMTLLFACSSLGGNLGFLALTDIYYCFYNTFFPINPGTHYIK